SGRMDNQLCSSKIGPTLFAEQNPDYEDRADLIWDIDESNLSDSQIDEYLQSTSHLPNDTALSILRLKKHNMESAIEYSKEFGVIPDLSPIEEKVLMAVAPLPNANFDLRLKHPMTTLNKIFSAFCYLIFHHM
ncbi:hypothetical protein PRIPAC_82144, partial [Pristionchus pacificus]